MLQERNSLLQQRKRGAIACDIGVYTHSHIYLYSIKSCDTLFDIKKAPFQADVGVYGE